MTESAARPIRSYVLRGGRVTTAQRRALNELWPQYGVAAERLSQTLAGAKPVLDIGYGNGESLIYAAEREPDTLIIGVEVHPPGIGAALKALAERDIRNVRLVRADARDLLKQHTSPGELAGVRLFFPDPWPKKRHHKRRIVQPDFIRLVASRLHSGGTLHLATDWAPYAAHMLSVIEADEAFRNLAGPYAFGPRPAYRPVTRFERRGFALGHVAHDLIYRRR